MMKLKIGISGLIYPMWMGRWIWDALDRREDCEVYSVGIFFNDWIPWGVPGIGMRLPQRYVKIPTVCLPPTMVNSPIPYDVVANQLPNDLDLFLQVDAGFHFSNRPKATITALLETDPHVLKRSYDLPKSYSDFTFCMQTPYMEDKEFYLPYGYDKYVHYVEKDVEKIYDVCLIGLHYNSRSAVLSALQNKGYKIKYSIGEIFDEYRHAYNQSKIAFSWSALQDLPARVWEGFAMGNLVVCNHVPDMQTFFVDGQHYLGFDTIEEAISKIEWALSNPEKAQKIAAAGHRKVRGHHWDHRVEQLLETCKLI